MDRPGVRQVPGGSGEQEDMEKTGCKIICGAPTTLSVKGLMMMLMALKNKPRFGKASSLKDIVPAEGIPQHQNATILLTPAYK